MRAKQRSDVVLNSAAGPLPTPVCGHEIPLSADLPNRAQAAVVTKNFAVERVIFGRRKTFFR
jgi:hypothetical protein